MSASAASLFWKATGSLFRDGSGNRIENSQLLRRNVIAVRPGQQQLQRQCGAAAEIRMDAVDRQLKQILSWMQRQLKIPGGCAAGGYDRYFYAIVLNIDGLQCFQFLHGRVLGTVHGGRRELTTREG